jgi:hypothetical protein
MTDTVAVHFEAASHAIGLTLPRRLCQVAAPAPVRIAFITRKERDLAVCSGGSSGDAFCVGIMFF